MTVEEKRKKLEEYHKTHKCDVDRDESDTRPKCIFEDSNSWCKKYNTTNIPEDVLDDVLNQIAESLTPTPTEDIINHPNHYTHGGMECIDEMIMIFGKEAVMHFCLCNAWKYRKRALYKNGQEDMDKSDWYLNKYKELGENE